MNHIKFLAGNLWSTTTKQQEVFEQGSYLSPFLAIDSNMPAGYNRKYFG